MFLTRTFLFVNRFSKFLLHILRQTKCLLCQATFEQLKNICEKPLSHTTKQTVELFLFLTLFLVNSNIKSLDCSKFKSVDDNAMWGRGGGGQKCKIAQIAHFLKTKMKFYNEFLIVHVTCIMSVSEKTRKDFVI